MQALLLASNSHFLRSGRNRFQCDKEYFNIVKGEIELFIGKASACNVGDTGSIPGSGRSPGAGNSNPQTSIHAWKIPEEPGRLQSTGLQRVRHD